MDNKPPGLKSLHGQDDTETNEIPASLRLELELHVELLLVTIICADQTT